MTVSTDQRESAYIRPEPRNGVGVDREAMLHRRRKASTISLLSEFERNIEPHLGPEHREAVKQFKRSCREKLNGLTFLGTELLRLRPGERINEAAADLAEQLAFDANGGQPKP